MSKVFNKNNQPKVEVKRNAFDLSYQNNLTMEMGKIYPVMCKEVLPGDTFKIKSAFGLRFMPLAFPIQTRMRADLHFFYVRNRNLWDQWTNFIGQTGVFTDGLNIDDVPAFPTLSYASFRQNSVTGSLGDYLGLPTTVPSGSGVDVKRNLEPYGNNFDYAVHNTNLLGYMPVSTDDLEGKYYYQHAEIVNSATAEPKLAQAYGCPIGENLDMSQCKLETAGSVSLFQAITDSNNPYVDISDSYPVGSGDLAYKYPWMSVNRVGQATFIPPTDYSYVALPLVTKNAPNKGTIIIKCPHLRPEVDTSNIYAMCAIVSANSNSIDNIIQTVSGLEVIPCKLNNSGTLEFKYRGAALPSNGVIYVYLFEKRSTDIRILNSFSDYFEQHTFPVISANAVGNENTYNFASVIHVNSGSALSIPAYVYSQSSLPSTFTTVPLSVLHVYQESDRNTSIVGSNVGSKYFGEMHVSALPFRAYESIYNAYYRDQRNNPYEVDNIPDPNRYIPTNGSGEDNNEYVLRRRNWEQDFLTSAMKSPQQGTAPLVGISSTGTATFQNADGSVVTAHLDTSDGDTVTGVRFSGDNAPDNAVALSAMNMASQGISINDFRAVNSYQRWLEINLRRGLKYKDQLMSHFGVDASYAVLDMPEFIGGSSRSVQIEQINQTSASSSSEDPLGSYAGQAYCVGGNDNDIEHYCDEHGFIIACLSIVPVPSYSQLMPKHFMKFQHLDYFFPEFGHIGYQPITYREVCPAQAASLDVPLDSTYGYQRAWYDYLASTDEIHGQFRDTLSPFVLTRVFRSLPSITPEFLTVDQDQMNEVFTVTEVDGTPVQPILGQVHFDIVAKRKIPRYGTPRIE